MYIYIDIYDRRSLSVDMTEENRSGRNRGPQITIHEQSLGARACYFFEEVCAFKKGTSLSKRALDKRYSKGTFRILSRDPSFYKTSGNPGKAAGY